MSDVIPHDFGKEKREYARKLLTLMGRLDKRNEELEENPARLFDMAGKQIDDLRRVVQSAQDALIPTLQMWDAAKPFGPIDDQITIPKSEYERLRKCAEIVESVEL